tara:strand:- start:932 stop:2110 length:1179 start_codon:yes stop_codon:yes gene_type:complete
MISFGEMESLAAEAQYGAERATRAAASERSNTRLDLLDPTDPVDRVDPEDLADPGDPGDSADLPVNELTPEERAAQITADAQVKAEQIRADSIAAQTAARELADKARREENLKLRQGAARDVLGSLLRNMFGDDSKAVSALTTQLNDLMVKGASELEIVQEIRGSTQYATRFPGMAARAEAGMPAISEREYIDLERNYRNLMRTSGIEERFYQDPARFGELIAGDVSAAELQSRVALAEEAASSADPEVVRQLEEFYGIDRAKLVEYYLDPEEAVNLFEEERRLQAAGLSAAAIGTVGQGFTQSVAERLQQENIQRREVQQRLGQRVGLTDRLLGEEEALTASEIAEAEFGLDAQAITQMRRRREERTAAFGGSGGVLSTRGGITGLGAADS